MKESTGSDCRSAGQWGKHNTISVHHNKCIAQELNPVSNQRTFKAKPNGSTVARPKDVKSENLCQCTM